MRGRVQHGPLRDQGDGPDVGHLHHKQGTVPTIFVLHTRTGTLYRTFAVFVEENKSGQHSIYRFECGPASEDDKRFQCNPIIMEK